METKIINQHLAIELIKEGNFSSMYQIFFDGSSIDAIDAMLLGKNGIDVPDDLIEYDDENIDYSDIPAITDEDIASGKIKWIRKAEIPIRKEIDDWIKNEKIDINKLLSDLMENFYQTMKNIQSKAAL